MLLALLLILAGLAGAIAPQTAAAKKSKFTFTPNTLYVPAEGGVYKVEISINEADTRFRIQEIITPSWIQPLGGIVRRAYGKYFMLSFFFRPNTEGSRGGTIIFKTTKGEVKYKLIQLGGAKPEPEKPTFTLEPKELELDAYAGEVYFRLSCDIPYHIEDYSDVDAPDWLKVNGYHIGGYETSHEMTIYYNTNTGGKREGVITFKTTEAFKNSQNVVKLKVTQEGGGDPKSFITLDPKELKVDAEGGAHKVTLSGKQGFDVSNLVIMPSWIRQGQTNSGPNSYSYTLEFQPNTGPERTADVVFTIGQGKIKLKVTQAGGAKPEPKPEAELTLDPKELKVEAEGGEHKVTLSSTQTIEKMDFENPDWIRYSYSPESHTSKAVYLTFEPNTGPERKADVVFKTDLGDVTLKVTQAAAKPELTLDPKELKVEAKGGAHKVTLGSKKDFKLNKVTLPSWISEGQSSSGPGIYGVTLEFQPNTGAERMGEIIFVG